MPDLEESAFALEQEVKKTVQLLGKKRNSDNVL